VVVVAVAAAYAGWASGTVPFTTASNVAVSLPSALLAGGLVARVVGGVSSPLAVPKRPGARSGRLQRRAIADGRHQESVDSAAPWVVLITVVVAVELASYFHGGSRSAYPTLSSLATDLFRHRPVKAAAFFAWLVGAWYLVAR
jgi:hypothetical protein